MKPGVSLQRTGCLPARSAQAYAASTAASSLRSVRTISTSGSTGAGLKKCIPMTRSGRSVASAISATESAEVFVARIASARDTRSSSANSSRFASSSSTIASITRSHSARSPGRSSCGAARARRRARPRRASPSRPRGREVLDPAAGTFVQLVAHLAPDDLVPREHADLRDARAHRPQTDDADGFDLASHGARSYRRFEQVTDCYLFLRPSLRSASAPARTAGRSSGCASAARGSVGRRLPPRRPVHRGGRGPRRADESRTASASALALGPPQDLPRPRRRRRSPARPRRRGSRARRAPPTAASRTSARDLLGVDPGVERRVPASPNQEPAGQRRSTTPAIAMPKPMHMHAIP